MSLRIIVKPDQIKNWIEQRGGTPIRRRESDDDVVISFGEVKPAAAEAMAGESDYEAVSIDELIESMKAKRMVLLVDQEPDKTFCKFVQHS